MILQIVPLKAYPNQTVNIILNNQNTNIAVYTANNHLYANLSLGQTAIIEGVPCNHGCYINPYTSAFIGHLFFWNTTGLDPVYTELGNTAYLFYSDYDALEVAYLEWVKNNQTWLTEEFGT